MSKESRFFTVKFVKTAPNSEGVVETTIEVKNYTAEQWNSAVLKFNEMSTYARSLKDCTYFRVSILNEWDGVEKEDTETITVAPEETTPEENTEE